jgi:hypothetical protein
VLSLLIVAGLFAIRQSETILARFYGFLKIALLLVRLDHVASFIVNANHGIMIVGLLESVIAAIGL